MVKKTKRTYDEVKDQYPEMTYQEYLDAMEDGADLREQGVDVVIFEYNGVVYIAQIPE